MSNIFQIWDHFFPLLLPKDSGNLKSLDFRLLEMGAKRPLNRVRNILLSMPKFAPKLPFLRGDFTPCINKSFQIWDHFFPLLVPKDYESLKMLDIRRTALWPQQTVRSSCWSSMFNVIRPEPTNKQFNSAYLKIKYLIHSNTFWLDETFSCWSQVTMMF